MLELLERQQRLTVNQRKIISAAILGDMLDFFDFFLIGYVLAFIVGEWKLSFLESGSSLIPPPSAEALAISISETSATSGARCRGVHIIRFRPLFLICPATWSMSVQFDNPALSHQPTETNRVSRAARPASASCRPYSPLPSR